MRVSREKLFSISWFSASMVVTAEADDACSLTWTGTFEPNGVPAEKADRIASSIYRGGIAGYAKALGC